MGITTDKAEIERLDFERLRANDPAFDRLALLPMGNSLPAMVGQVISVQANIKAGQFCRVAPTTVLGNEGEGGSGMFTPLSQGATTPPVLVYLLGSFVPMVGDYLICRFVDHRWVSVTTGGSIAHGSGIALPNCFCTVPATLQMTSGDPNCNYRMFQSCTIAYGPPPPAMVAFNFHNNVFTSTTSFVDLLSGSSFFYYFYCQYNQFFLTRFFPTSPYGSPFRDGILYSWVVGGYANTCTPFQLLAGSAYPGSDASCSVSIIGN